MSCVLGFEQQSVVILVHRGVGEKKKKLIQLIGNLIDFQRTRVSIQIVLNLAIRTAMLMNSLPPATTSTSTTTPLALNGYKCVCSIENGFTYLSACCCQYGLIDFNVLSFPSPARSLNDPIQLAN